MITLESLEKLKQLESSLPYGEPKGVVKAVICFLKKNDSQAVKELWKRAFKLGQLCDALIEWLNDNAMLPTTMNEPDLKPCPFCKAITVWVDITEPRGDHAEIPSQYYVKCDYCQACGPLTQTEQHAILLWNQTGEAL